MLSTYIINEALMQIVLNEKRKFLEEVFAEDFLHLPFAASFTTIYFYLANTNSL